MVVSGHIEVLVDGEWMALAAGHAVRFAADRAHGYHDLNEYAAVFHNLIHYGHPAGAAGNATPHSPIEHRRVRAQPSHRSCAFLIRIKRRGAHRYNASEYNGEPL